MVYIWHMAYLEVSPPLHLLWQHHWWDELRTETKRERMSLTLQWGYRWRELLQQFNSIKWQKLQSKLQHHIFLMKWTQVDIYIAAEQRRRRGTFAE